jgi:hypothetical protein
MHTCEHITCIVSQGSDQAQTSITYHRPRTLVGVKVQMIPVQSTSTSANYHNTLAISLQVRKLFPFDALLLPKGSPGYSKSFDEKFRVL